ncbi:MULTISPECIES: hypothetical protein [Agrobacterium]|uniref:Uncharacterized protein n=1 Tax=Agrobacterium larrymoorei TaxID=160699 RepID=A0ABX8TFM2_9HYPH|nr:hypothetical protein [Agrobacterium larrymoorei]NSZ10075.1 hypothetical protein [Agrobacterium tumefaciens]QYA10806.1 hypothetical protein J5285_25975 [Agrobacterium larrymoorei]
MLAGKNLFDQSCDSAAEGHTDLKSINAVTQRSGDRYLISPALAVASARWQGRTEEAASQSSWPSAPQQSEGRGVEQEAALTWAGIKP